MGNEDDDLEKLSDKDIDNLLKQPRMAFNPEAPIPEAEDISDINEAVEHELERQKLLSPEEAAAEVRAENAEAEAAWDRLTPEEREKIDKEFVEKKPKRIEEIIRRLDQNRKDERGDSDTGRSP